MSKVLPVVIGVLMGFGLSKLSEILSRKKSIQNAGTDLINEIHLLKSPVKDQTISLDELVIQLKIEKFDPPQLELNFLLDTKRIELINRNYALEYFVRIYKQDRKQAREKLNKIYSGLDIITFESKRIEDLWNKYIEKGTMYFKQWKQNLDAIQIYYADCIVDNEKKGNKVEDDTFLNSFNHLNNEQIIQMKNHDIFIMRNNFHKPLSKLVAENRIDPRVQQLRDYNYQCFNAINELHALRQDCAMKFERISNSLSFQYSKLQTVINL